MRNYRLYKNSPQWKFHQSRAKIQLLAGGFAGGKSAALCVKPCQLFQDYPGMNVLMARESYPKLNDTLRKEFFKWCPTDWIEHASLSKDNTVILKNGTTINFRYVQQQGKQEGGTSNLLSATYDLIVVDQIEDPGILHKDFLDLLGRLRGNTKYVGDDMTMPRTGPRWLLASCNPSRNWVFRTLVRPLQVFTQSGFKSPDLMVDKRGNPMVDLFEVSTYDNKDNLEPDFIESLESAYSGQMRDRYLLGKWAAYEGLVYPSYDENVHIIRHAELVRHLRRLTMMGFRATIIEGYDHGMAKQSCYILGFGDDKHNVFLLDGFYEKEQDIGTSADAIERIRNEYDIIPTAPILADPAVFRRGGTSDKKVVGRTTADIFSECGISMMPGNNEIVNGIAKVQAYLKPTKFHKHPLTNAVPAPHLYVSDKLEFVDKEITDYFWKRDTENESEDKPQDRNDHAMDTIKYILGEEPTPAVMIHHHSEEPEWNFWHERGDVEDERLPARRRAS